LVDRLLEIMPGDLDPLAQIYERIVAGARRRKLGTFFTPTPVLQYMRDILDTRLPEAPETVADPGAGVGAFTASALKWWPKATVHALDVNLVTLGLLAVQPNLYGQGMDRRLHVRQADFLSWLGASWPRLRGPRLILGNPPYTRHQQLTPEQKRYAQEAAGSISPGRRAGLSTYFLAAGLDALSPRDSLCLLLPMNWLEADYARSVRSHLWQEKRRQIELHLFPNHLEVFPGTQVAAMVIYVGPIQNGGQPMSLHKVIGRAGGGFESSGIVLARREGPAPRNFSDVMFTPPQARKIKPSTVPLAQIVHIRRGVATGANKFFLRTLHEKHQLPEDTCVRAVSRLRDLPTEILSIAEHNRLGATGVRCWLLNLTRQDADKPDVLELLREGVREGFHERHLCKIRSPWYALEKVIVPDLLLGPMGKDKFRIVVNEAGATPTNTLYGLRMRDKSHPESVEVLARWLSSSEGQQAMRAVARQHGDGLLKLEPGPLSTIEVPANILDSTSNVSGES
jgi:hypothetical protein